MKNGISRRRLRLQKNQMIHSVRASGHIFDPLSVIHSPLLLISLLLCLSVSGCNMLLRQEHRVVTQHIEQPAMLGDQPVMQVSNQSELNTVLIQLIRQRVETGRIKLNNYTGDIKNDLPNLCADIVNEHPIGSYAVRYIDRDYMPFGNEVLVTIFYVTDRVSDIPEISNLSVLTDELEDAIDDFKEKLVLVIGDYESGADMQALLRDAYYRKPERAVDVPRLSFSLYPPDGGLSRVVEIELTYPRERWAVERRVSQAEQDLDRLLAALPEDLDLPFRALELYKILCAAVSYDEKAAQAQWEGEWHDSDDNLYTAVVGKRAISAGFALAYKLMCDKAGVECRLVQGRRDNAPYFWNIVRLDGEWYHVDIAGDARAGSTGDWFLITDDKMDTSARWDQAATPKCVSTQYTYEMLVPPPIEEDPEDAEPAGLLIDEDEVEAEI